MLPKFVAPHPYLEPRLLFASSMVLLGVSGLGVLFLSTLQKTDLALRHAKLTRSLWKCDPHYSSSSSSSSFSQRLGQQEQRRAWFKLLCAGSMMAAMALSLMVKVFPPDVALGLTVCALALWVVYLFYYWYAVVEVGWRERDKLKDEEKKLRKDKEKENQAAGASWIKRNREIGSNSDSRLPATILTGYLGSGKTTLLKNILNNTAGLKILVIENEIGEQGIDHELLMQHGAKEDIILMNNGCICCTVRNDLLTTFHRMFANEAFSRLDWIVIETTGLADPAPLIHSFYMDSQCQQRMRIDSVLTVVDCKHLPLQLTKKSGAHGGISEAIKQISYADRIIINKTDLVTERDVEILKKSISEINPYAITLNCTYGDVEVSQVLDIKAFDGNRFQNLDQQITQKPILIQRDEAGKILKRNVKLNFGRPANPTGKGNIVSFSFISNQPLDLSRFNEWITVVLQAQGSNIYRMKGILKMKGYDEVFVCHGVHMIFDGEKTSTLWEDKTESKLVFIGSDLDRDDFEAGFRSTIAD